jgi:hypothetical protein
MVQYPSRIVPAVRIEFPGTRLEQPAQLSHRRGSRDVVPAKGLSNRAALIARAWRHGLASRLRLGRPRDPRSRQFSGSE